MLENTYTVTKHACTIITWVTYSALIWDTEGAAAFFVGGSFSVVAILSSYNDKFQKKYEIRYCMKVIVVDATREQFRERYL